MTLKEYLSSLSRPERAAAVKRIAQRCDVTEGAVHHWVHGRRKISPAQAATIVRITDGFVSLPDLIPELNLASA